jgi:undecaprenyl phosphate-alpha-L-ara4FN deformylase
MPTLDEVLCRPEVTEQGAAGMLAGMVRPGRINVFTLHAEVEGRRYRPVLEEFCRRLQEAGVRFLTLVEAARAEAEHAPAEAVTWGPVAERAYPVAWQASALGRG